MNFFNYYFMKKIDRFDKYMKYKGLTDYRVTKELNLSVGLISKSRQESRDLSYKVTEQILNYYTDLNRTWLLTGEGEMLKDDIETDETTNENRVNIPREAFDQISKLTETIMKLTETVLSQQKTIEALEAEIKKSRARQEEHAISADAELSNVG